MTKNREELESRILQILGYIKNEELLALFRENPNIFSDEDLVLVLNFLETGENNFLWEFLDRKIKESQEMINVQNTKKILERKSDKLKEEENEKKEEENEVESLILNF